mgnify:FL=1
MDICVLWVLRMVHASMFPEQVRMKLVKDWLPVLIICKENVSHMMSSHKSLYQELEETFLRIISTLPMSDAQELLQQCLSFSTRNVDDCPHLVTAFTTWFRRANRSLPAESLRQWWSSSHDRLYWLQSRLSLGEGHCYVLKLLCVDDCKLSLLYVWRRPSSNRVPLLSEEA